MPPIDIFLDQHAQYYISYDFKRLLELSGFHLDKLMLVKEQVDLEDGVKDVLVLRAMVIDRGVICYPKIYPRYFTDAIDDSLLGECDNANIRFSIFFNKTGFFSPLWESIIKGDRTYTPNGRRIDWDVMQGRVPRMTRQKYQFLKQQAKNSTSIDNQEVVARTLPIWLRSTAILDEDIDPMM